VTPNRVPLAVGSSRGRLLFTAVWIWCFALGTGFLSGCPSRIPLEYRPFFALPLAEQDREIQKYPLDKQVDLYLSGVRVIRPPPIGLAYPIAKSGPAAVPGLLRRLRQAQDEVDQLFIIYVFEKMAKFYYPLKDNTDVVTSVREVVARMQDPLWRRESEASLRVIAGLEPNDSQR